MYTSINTVLLEEFESDDIMVKRKESYTNQCFNVSDGVIISFGCEEKLILVLRRRFKCAEIEGCNIAPINRTPT